MAAKQGALTWHPPMGSPSAASKPAEMMTRSGANSAGGWEEKDRDVRKGRGSAAAAVLLRRQAAVAAAAAPQALTVRDRQQHVRHGRKVVCVAHAAARPRDVDRRALAVATPHLGRGARARVELAAAQEGGGAGPGGG